MLILLLAVRGQTKQNFADNLRCDDLRLLSRIVDRSHFHQVKPGFPGLLQSLGGWHESQLLPIDTDEANRGDADVLVHARATILRRQTVEISNR